MGPQSSISILQSHVERWRGQGVNLHGLVDAHRRRTLILVIFISLYSSSSVLGDSGIVVQLIAEVSDSYRNLLLIGTTAIAREAVKYSGTAGKPPIRPPHIAVSIITTVHVCTRTLQLPSQVRLS